MLTIQQITLILLIVQLTVTNSERSFMSMKPFKLHFKQNTFKFNVLVGPDSPSLVVGQLQIKETESTRRFLKRNKLNFTIEATRDQSSLELFKLNTKSLQIELTGQNRRELIIGSKHFLRVHLFDVYKRYVPTWCIVQIDIMDNVNKNAPVFEKTLYEAQIVENNAPNTLIVKVIANDLKDYGRNSDITYHFVNPNLVTAFQIESHTGEIYAKKILNREEKDFYNFTVRAIDNGMSSRLNSTVTVNVRVLAESNKSPRFNKHEFNLTLPENSNVNTKPIVLVAKAIDTDNTTNLIYSLAGSLNDMNTFEIESNTGTVRLVSRLNYELKSQYQLNIVARDLSQPPRATYAKLNVLIEPSNPTPPLFTVPFYEFILYENAPIGQVVGRVIAYQKQSSLFKNSSIVYSLNNEATDLPFTINPLNGTITTSKKIYKNFKRYGYEFSVIASLQVANFLSNSSVKIKIKILDINDLVPEFTNTVYNINISEVTTIGLPLLTLKTKATNEQSILDYSIELGNENNIFSLVKQGAYCFLTTKRSNLNYKSQSTYELVVKVMDQDGLYSTAKITANIIPADVYSPRFTKSIYKFRTYENSPVNTFIGQISAQIPSGLEYENLVYQIITVQGSSLQHNSDFSLNYKTGNLYVATSGLDREKYDLITVYVTASVGKLIDHAIIQVELIDANDNPPLFTRSFYSAQIYKNDAHGSYLLRVEATDKDLDSNSVIKYSIKEPTEYVSIDSSSGVIRLKRQPLGDLNLTLIAQDCGEPAALASEVSVLIKSIHRDHLAPQFDRATLKFKLVENMPSGTVIGEIKARDPDNGINANVVYKLLSNELFELQPSGTYNTVLLVTKFVSDLNKLRSSLLSLKVRAYSSSSSAATNIFTDCDIQVNIQRLNEYKPSVPNPIRIVFNNYKNYFLTPNSAFIPVYNDYHEASNISFSLIDSIGKQVVDLNELTGEIKFKAILNSNNLINVSFLVGVNDGVHQSVTKCHLTVLMLSDNLIADSVTISLANIDSNVFLDMLYLNFTNTLLSMLPQSQMSNIHLFNLVNSSFGLNVSLSVSYDYEKDLFMPANVLKQIIYSNRDRIEKNMAVSELIIYEDESCAIEPCFNFQNCINKVKIGMHNNNEFLHAEQIQFRSISVQHDFECKCPNGFTGKNSSVVCDLEINLCYSNPCGHNGQCLSLESGYRCLCDVGFTGKSCEFNLNQMKCCESPSNDFITTTTTTTSTLSYQNLIPNNSTSSHRQSSCAAVHSTPQHLFSAVSSFQNSNHICRSTSKCKNLILGGIVCDKCANNLNAKADKSFYNKFCELRAKSFPQAKEAFLSLPGISNRFRFNIKLTFATTKHTGYLFHNARLDQHHSPAARDFISLRLLDGYLIFEYSLGSEQSLQIAIRNITVSDGKWRTVTVNYNDHKFTISLDNDHSATSDACELAINSKESLVNCFRSEALYRLPAKCSSQVETCFRYFDLNGPLTLGRHSDLGATRTLTHTEKELNYEGCISDLIINKRLIDLGSEVIIDHNTQIGCQMKSNEACDKLKHKCSNCETIWKDKVKCDVSDSTSVFSVASNGYLSLKTVKTPVTTFQTHFLVKMSEESFIATRHRVIAAFDIFTSSSPKKQSTLLLKYNSYQLELIKGNVTLLQLAADLTDNFWNKIKITITASQFELVVNNKLKASTEFRLQTGRLQMYVGGAPNSKNIGMSGCMKQVGNVILRESVNVTKGCQKNESIAREITSQSCSQVCFNNATCLRDSSEIKCQCQEGYKGKYCQYEHKRSNSLTNTNSTCPAKWWGNEPGICGPCKCDESKNFSPDCNKTNGECECKANYFKRVNKLTGDETCVPCNCYLEGSESLQCEQLTGQCKCMSGAGITGKHCDQCVSPFAEMVSGAYECRQMSSNECPRAFKFNTWWPRTKFESIAVAKCPKGSVGKAYRLCETQTSGWAGSVDLTECKSETLLQMQLYKWSKLLSGNSSLLNSYQALELAHDLNQITKQADDDDELNYDDSFSFVATSTNSLYANDLATIKNLTTYIIQFEIANAPSFLFIQDKYFLHNIFTTLSRLLSKKYEPKLQQLRKNDLIEYKNETKQGNYDLIDLFITIDTYLRIIVQYDQYHSSVNTQINLPNFQLYINKIIGQSYSENTLPSANFKLITTADSKNKKLGYILLDSLSSNLPNKLMIGPNDLKLHRDDFITVSNILMVNLHRQNDETNTDKSLYIVIDFVLTNIFPAAYDKDLKNLKIAPNSNYYCVYLDPVTKSWSTKGAKLVSYNYDTNTVKCSYDHFSIYAVVTSTSGLSNAANTQPVEFSLLSYVLMPISFVILFATCTLLFLVKKFATPMIQIYFNLVINVLAMQMIFFFGINANSSAILCKFLAVLQHYLHLSAYIWLLIGVVHLYRILTELRDINKMQSPLPVFYYVIAIALPAIVVTLTLAIKQEIYTNFSQFTSLSDTSSNNFSHFYLSSVYCWLCVTNYYEIFYVLVLPLTLLITVIIVVIILTLNECKQTTFKKSEVPFVKQNILTCFVILIFQMFVTAFLLMVIYAASSSNLIKEFELYQYLYLAASVLYSVQLVLVLFIFNNTNKQHVLKLKNSLSDNSVLNESLDTSKLNLYKRSPPAQQQLQPNAININDLGAEVLANINEQVFKVNSKYMLDYRNLQAHTNSVSTTTTSGTSEDCDFQANYFKKQFIENNNNTSNGYMSHLANTTNTESTVNDSEFYSSRFDFTNRQSNQQEAIRESDVINVGQILKNRQLLTTQTATNMDDSDDMMMPVDFTNKQAFKDTEITTEAALFNEQNYLKQITNSNRIQSEINKCYEADNAQNTLSKRNQSLSLFWPNTVAECDTSYLEGSLIFTPNQVQAQLKRPNSNNSLQVANNTKANHSYNSNTTSNTGSYSTSTSSLVLNSNSLERPPIKVATPGSSSNAVLILTHTGSPTSSDSESGNETRV